MARGIIPGDSIYRSGDFPRQHARIAVAMSTDEQLLESFLASKCLETEE